MAFLLEIFSRLQDASLWALDETGKRLESNNYYSWGPKGKYKVIEHNGNKKGLNIIGATEILNHFNFIYDEYEKCTEDAQNITSKEVIRFLNKLIHYDKERGVTKTVILLDNARFHRSKEVRAFAKQHRDELALIFQPKYSPELNPQENMWNWLKKNLASDKAFGSIVELSKYVQKFANYVNANPVLVNQRVGATHYYK